MRSINLTAALLFACLCVQALNSHFQRQAAQAGLEAARANFQTQRLSEEAHRRFADAVESWRKAVDGEVTATCRR